MSLKKQIISLAVLLAAPVVLAYPALQDEDPIIPVLQPYAAQMEQMQKAFEKELLPPLKELAQMALETQESAQEDLTPQQERKLTLLGEQLSVALAKLVAPALKEIDIAQLNQQYKQLFSSSQERTPDLTKEEVAELLKAMYLMGALGYFEQKQKLDQQELEVLMEILFSQDDEEED